MGTDPPNARNKGCVLRTGLLAIASLMAQTAHRFSEECLDTISAISGKALAKDWIAPHAGNPSLVMYSSRSRSAFICIISVSLPRYIGVEGLSPIL